MTVLEDRDKLYPIRMLDVYAGNVWNPVQEKARGIRGVICKAGQGGFYSLPPTFISDCENNGLDWGLYWLIDSRFDSGYHMRAIKQNCADLNFGPLGWWWDCEKPQVTMERLARICHRQVHRLVGKVQRNLYQSGLRKTA